MVCTRACFCRWRAGTVEQDLRLQSPPTLGTAKSLKRRQSAAGHGALDARPRRHCLRHPVPLRPGAVQVETNSIGDGGGRPPRAVHVPQWLPLEPSRLLARSRSQRGRGQDQERAPRRLLRSVERTLSDHRASVRQWHAKSPGSISRAGKTDVFSTGPTGAPGQGLMDSCPDTSGLALAGRSVSLSATVQCYPSYSESHARSTTSMSLPTTRVATSYTSPASSGAPHTCHDSRRRWIFQQTERNSLQLPQSS